MGDHTGTSAPGTGSILTPVTTPTPATPGTTPPVDDREGPQKIIYGPDDWNNSPTLAFLRHQLDAGNYVRQGQQGSYDPKMGINLGSPQSLNYGDLLQVLANPASTGFAQSAWQSANRDFNSDVAMSKMFAPVWDQSVYGNLIRT